MSRDHAPRHAVVSARAAPRNGLGDAGGSGVHVFDEIVPEIDGTRAEYEELRSRALDALGLIPHDTAATSVGKPGTWTYRAIPAHAATRAELNAALQKSEWWPSYWDNRPADVGVAPGDLYVHLPPLATVSADGLRVLDNPSGPATFRSPFVSGIYGRDPLNWVDLPADSRVLVRLDDPLIPQRLLDGAPIYQVPIWKAWGGDAENRLVAMAAIPARRVGVSTGDRHSYALLRDDQGRPLGYIGVYETGGSGNFLQSGVGRFIAREIAEGIVEVVVTVVGNIVTPGAGFSEGEAAGHFVSGALDSAIGLTPTAVQPLFVPVAAGARVVESATPTALTELGNKAIASAALEGAYAVNPAAVDRVFADAALLSTNLAGLDDVLLGIGTLFRSMAVWMQSDPATLARELAQRQAAIGKAGGQLLAIAKAVAQVAAQIIVSVATAGAAAPYLAAVKALEGALETAYAGGDMTLAGTALLKASAAFVPVVGDELVVAAGAVEVGARGDWAHAGATIAESVASMIPEVGGALASAGKAAVAIADAQDSLRRIDLAQDRARSSQRLRDNADAIAFDVQSSDHSGAVAAAAATARGPAERAKIIDAARAKLRELGDDGAPLSAAAIAAGVAATGAAAWLARALLRKGA